MPLPTRPRPVRKIPDRRSVSTRNTMASFVKTKKFKETHRPYKKIINE